MSHMQVHGYGNVASDPKHTQLSNGNTMITFRLACNDWRGGKEEVSFYNCTWFLPQTAKKQSRLIKGATVVVVSGRWTVRTSDRDDGKRNYYNDLVIDSSGGLQFPPSGKRPEPQGEPAYREAHEPAQAAVPAQAPPPPTQLPPEEVPPPPPREEAPTAAPTEPQPSSEGGIPTPPGGYQPPTNPYAQ